MTCSIVQDRSQKSIKSGIKEYTALVPNVLHHCMNSNFGSAIGLGSFTRRLYMEGMKSNFGSTIGLSLGSFTIRLYMEGMTSNFGSAIGLGL